MEPHANNVENTPGNSVEQQPQNPENNASPDRKLEKFPIGALEQLGGDRSQERTGAISSDPQAATDAATTLTTMPTPIQDDTSTVAATTQTPVAAADDDVIEKEWVNKAKKVINQTKGDPYTKEREVSKLQADYMQKRYGKQVKMPDET